ncbi:MAG: HAD family hydrolase [Phocaeicola sp.]
MGKIKNLIFDFGGVIVDLDREEAVKKFIQIGVSNADELLDRYHQRGIFLEVEDGRVTAEEFRAKLSALCGRELTYDEVESGWKGFITKTEQYKLDYLNELRDRGYKVYILSNTNPYIANWARNSTFTPAGKPLDSYVDAVYTSYEIGSMKPEKAIFEFLIADSGIDPHESLFIDDAPANVAIGNELGFETIQPENGEDWRNKIEKLLI